MAPPVRVRRLTEQEGQKLQHIVRRGAGSCWQKQGGPDRLPATYRRTQGITSFHHTVQTRALHNYLRWRNNSARHPEVLAAQRRERARIRSEKGIRWGGRPLLGAA